MNSLIPYQVSPDAPLLLETICVQGGAIQRASLHCRRMEAGCGCPVVSGPEVLEELFRAIQPVSLAEQTYKFRLIYSSQGVHEATVKPYRPRMVRSLRMIEVGDSIDYRLKYADRSALNALSKGTGAPDCVPLLLRRGALTDTTYSNVCLWHRTDRVWHTPEQYLLNGVMRQWLLGGHHCRTADITLDTLHRYSRISLINALLPLGCVELPIDQVL